MRYELFYWPGIQGRGEFVRLALEEADADYVDVARRKDGIAKMMREMNAGPHPPFAPPFFKAGNLVIAQTANILLYIGDHHGLAPRSEAGRLWTHQLQLTIADVVAEAHNVHHPVAANLYYDDQKREARRAAKSFIKERIPKYLGYFENVLERAGGDFLLGRKITYADLSLFQLVEGLRYAFPRAMKRAEHKLRRVVALHDKVMKREQIAAYLASPRRLPFNEEGIFRHYPELDA